MKLQQNQVWRLRDQYIRIVNLERLVVDYKTLSDLANRTGTHRRITKKEFCRMLKGAVLLTPEENQALKAAMETNVPPAFASADTDPVLDDDTEETETTC